MTWSTYKLYELVNPIDNQPFYIGITKRKINLRLNQHICLTKYEWKINPYKASIIYDLKKQGLKPIINCLFDNLSIEEANNLEIDMIDKMRILGYSLTNISDGGNCMTKESCLKISKAMKGRKLSKFRIDNMRKNNKNKKSINSFDVSNNFVKNFSSIQEASRITGTMNISRSIKLNIFAGGFKWKFEV